MITEDHMIEMLKSLMQSKKEDGDPWTQRYIAQRLGITEPTVNRWLKGKAKISATSRRIFLFTFDKELKALNLYPKKDEVGVDSFLC